MAMKINPQMSNMIKIVSGDQGNTKKARLEDGPGRDAADVVSLENKQASESRVESVEDAKNLLAQVTTQMKGQSSGLHNLNTQRLMNLIS